MLASFSSHKICTTSLKSATASRSAGTFCLVFRSAGLSLSFTFRTLSRAMALARTLPCTSRYTCGAATTCIIPAVRKQPSTNPKKPIAILFMLVSLFSLPVTFQIGIHSKHLSSTSARTSRPMSRAATTDIKMFSSYSLYSTAKCQPYTFISLPLRKRARTAVFVCATDEKVPVPEMM